MFGVESREVLLVRTGWLREGLRLTCAAARDERYEAFDREEALDVDGGWGWRLHVGLLLGRRVWRVLFSVV